MSALRTNGFYTADIVRKHSTRMKEINDEKNID